jgi:urocanate hydratase
MSLPTVASRGFGSFGSPSYIVTAGFGVFGPVAPVDAWEDRIAQAVANELNDHLRAWSTLFMSEGTTAVRTRKPWYRSQAEVASLATLKCDVVPLTIERDRAARGVRLFNYGVGISLQKLVDPSDDVTLKALSRMAEQIHDWFDDGHALALSPGDWICLKADRTDVYDLSRLYADEIWENIIEMTVRGYRA